MRAEQAALIPSNKVVKPVGAVEGSLGMTLATVVAISRLPPGVEGRQPVASQPHPSNHCLRES
jgi:hypothetical protein